MAVDPIMYTNSYAVKFMGLIELYQSEAYELRDWELIHFARHISTKIDNNLGSQISKDLWEFIFPATVEMLKNQYELYLDIAKEFFFFLEALLEHQFDVFMDVHESKFKIIVDLIVYSVNKNLSYITEEALNIWSLILKKMNGMPNVFLMNRFYSFHYINFLDNILEIMTCGMHETTFPLQVRIFQLLIQALPNLDINLNDIQKSNYDFFLEHVINVMSNKFGNLSLGDHQRHVKNIFNAAFGNDKNFLVNTRDYVISLRGYTNQELAQGRAVLAQCAN